MKTKLLLFVVIFSFVFSGLKAQVDVGDSLALVDLYNSTGGANWDHNNNWLTKKPVDTWVGIRVRNQRVTHISLFYNRVIGTLPESIGHFDSLIYFGVSDNGISGTIPSSICNWKVLDALNISSNSFSGVIPDSIGNLTKVTFLSLANNELTGNIPSSLSNCIAITDLRLGGNKLIGQIPSLKKMTGLQILELYSNSLSGTFDDVFAPEANLIELSIGGNRFYGPIRPFLSRFTNLTELYMYENRFSGRIPSELGDLKQLEKLDLSKNELSGTLPSTIMKLSRLSTLSLYDNQLTADGNQQFSGQTDSYVSLAIWRNKFTFNGLEYLVQRYYNVYYDPQQSIEAHSLNKKLAVSAGGTLSNNTYKWFKVGNPDPVIVKGDSTFQPTESGNYYARITNIVVPFLTLRTDTIQYTLSFDKKVIISISPNPARGVISIYGLDEKKDMKITVADVSGNIWVRAVSRMQSTLKMDMSRLKAGNYLVTVSDGKEVKTVMFVKE